MRVIDGVVVFGDYFENALEQAKALLPNALHVALSADNHLGSISPVGSIAAYDNAVLVNAAGPDIACGNAAIKTNKKLSDITKNKLTLADAEANPYALRTDPYLTHLANDIAKNIAFGIGTVDKMNDNPKDHPLFLDDAWYVFTNEGGYRDDLREKARKQLGSVGSGNHYVNVFVDREDETIWVGVHFGSRGLGYNTFSGIMALSQGLRWGERFQEKETLLSLDTQLGKDYWALMELAGKYAYAGREWVCRKVMSLFQGEELDLVHNHHNFSWKETHIINGETREVIVGRKGATPAFPNQRGFVGSSMGEDSVILQGKAAEWSPLSLNSTVHGAGRVMSRTEAAGKRNRRTGKLKIGADGKPVKPPKVTRDMMNTWIHDKGVILRGAGVDESPHCYKRLPEVLEAHGDTVEILHTLKPIIVAMADSSDNDPYGD